MAQISVTVSAEDRLVIEERAASANLSVSAYLRACGLGRVDCRSNPAVVDQLVRMNRELADVGMSAANAASEQVFESLLHHIQELQGALARLASRL